MDTGLKQLVKKHLGIKLEGMDIVNDRLCEQDN